jgi:hypothetical protein
MKNNSATYDTSIDKLKYEKAKYENIRYRFDTANDIIAGLFTMLPGIVDGLLHSTVTKTGEERNDALMRVAGEAVSTTLSLYKLYPNLDNPEVRAIIAPPVEMTKSEYKKYITDRERSVDLRTHSIVFAGKLTPLISSENDVDELLSKYKYIIGDKIGYLQSILLDPNIIPDPGGVTLRSVEDLYQLVAYEAEYIVIPKYNDELCDDLDIDYNTLVATLTRQAIKIVGDKVPQVQIPK